MTDIAGTVGLAALMLVDEGVAVAFADVGQTGTEVRGVSFYERVGIPVDIGSTEGATRCN